MKTLPELSGVLPANYEEIDHFEREVGRYRAGEWDDNQYIGFRVTRGVYGQRQADEQMMRIKGPLGLMTADQLDAIGDIAERYSELSRGHITTRENIQIHFTKLEDTPKIMRRLAEVGLTTREACGNTVRNVTGSPMAGVCPHEPFDVTPYATAYARYFLRHPVTQKLPRKFKSCYTCCDQDDAITAIHDLGFVPRVRVVGGREERGFKVLVGGGTSIFARTAFTFSEFVSVDEYLRLSEAILRVFDACDELRKNRQRARLKFHVHRVGIEVFRAEVEEELAKPWAQSPIGAGQLEEALEVLAMQPAAGEVQGDPNAAVPEGDLGFRLWVESNTVPQRQPGFQVVTVRVPAGNLTPAGFRAMAELAREYARSEVRLTAQQNLVLRWVRTEKLLDLYRALEGLELAGRANTVSDVTSCPGTDSCKLGITASIQLGQHLSKELIDLDDDSLKGVHVKISGCPNGCGQHHVADIGLEGASTKQGSVTLPCYHLYLGGTYSGGEATAGSAGTQLANRAGIRLPAKNAPVAVRRLLTTYRDERHGEEETFRAWVDRSGPDYFKELLGDLSEAPVFGPTSVDQFIDFGRKDLFVVQRGEGECMA